MLVLTASCQGLGQTSDKEWQAKAVAKYPALGVQGSELNKRFLDAYTKRKTDPNFLSNPRWPLILADELAATPRVGSTETPLGGPSQQKERPETKQPSDSRDNGLPPASSQPATLSLVTPRPTPQADTAAGAVLLFGVLAVGGIIIVGLVGVFIWFFAALRRKVSVPLSAGADHEDPSQERDIFEITPSASAFLIQIFFGIILSPVLIGISMLLDVWIKTRSTRYRLTSQRLIIRRGLIAKHLEEIELYRIKDVTVNQGVIQRLLGYGSVTVLANDDTTPVTLMVGVANPLEVKEIIRNQYRAARSREGVRATEFIRP